jgi:hypothetical protein
VTEVFDGWLDPYVRRAPRRLLPARPRRGALLDPVMFLVAPAHMATEYLVDVGCRGIGRWAHGPAWSGGWDSDAGRFALAVQRTHWLRRGSRRTDLRLALAPDGVVLFPGASEQYAVRCGPRPQPAPRRHLRRVDLAFPDGSWIALRLRTPAQATRLRTLLSGGHVPRHRAA